MDPNTQQIENVTELDTGMLQANPLQPRGIITQESLSDLV